MPTALARVAAAGALALLATTARDAGAQLPLEVQQVCTPFAAACSPPSSAHIFRGRTNRVKVVGPFVDQVGVIKRSNTAIGVTKVSGYPCSGVGCLELDVTVPQSFSLTEPVTFTLELGLSKALFIATAERLGKLDPATLTQSVATPTWGTAVNVTVEGNDIANPKVEVSNSTVSNLQFSLLDASTQRGRISFTTNGSGARPSSSTYDASISIRDAGETANIYDGYIAVKYPVATVACASVPGIEAPAPYSPANGSTLTFNSTIAAEPTVVITLRWNKPTSAPDTERYIYELRPAFDVVQAGSRTTTTTTTTIDSNLLTKSGTTAAGIRSVQLTLNRGRSYEWRVRAYNCGQSSPFSAYSRFTLQ